MDEIKINMIEKTDEGLVLKLPTTSVEQVKGLKEKLSEKVDKVEGKQLSTNDYSTEDKNKLAELENYDDTNIKADIAKKVDKVSGKGLSTNDYTDLEKIEVAKIKNLATNETVEGIKLDVENLKTSKVDKVTGKGLSTNDYDNTEKSEVAKIKDKVDKTYVDTELSDKATVTDLTKKIDKTSITSDFNEADITKVLSQKGANELNKKFDTIGSSRAATIVIANYDSTEKSKKGADYVVKKGEDASKVIMNAEQELVGFGGKMLLMEGKYDCQSAIVLGYAETILEGCNATLVQNENWSVTEYGEGTTSNHIIANYENMESIIVNNIKIVGKNVKDSKGIYCYSTSQVNNCIVSNTGNDGISCNDSSQANNCVVNNAGYRGICCWESSRANNCTVSGTGGNGISCNNSSQISNCTVSGTGSRGISCNNSSQISNCTVSGAGGEGITCSDSSQITNCTVSDADGEGIICYDSSQITNCTVSDAGVRGISCYDSSQISNCTVSGTGGNGISCWNTFKGICSFNVLKGCELTDTSSTPAKVQYNIIQ